MTSECFNFESIEALHRGDSSDRRSKDFLVRLFLRVLEQDFDSKVQTRPPRPHIDIFVAV